MAMVSRIHALRWLPTNRLVAQVGNLLFRRLTVGRALVTSSGRRLPICDTADCQSAPPGLTTTLSALTFCFCAAAAAGPTAPVSPAEVYDPGRAHTVQLQMS